MQAFPHIYFASALGTATDDVTLKGAGLPPLRSAAPAEFGGPGDRWSPETLLVAAIADCFILTFRAVAKAAKLPWISVTCDVDGTLDRVDRVTQFTEFNVRARLLVPEGTKVDEAHRLLEQAERVCLITNSLKATPKLDLAIDFAPAPEPVAAWHQAD